MTFDRAMLEVQTYGGRAASDGHLANAEATHACNDLAQVARSCLQTTPYADVKAVQCECHEGVLVLRGRVSTYYHKQLAQEAVRDIQGIESIVNVVGVIGRNSSAAARKPR